MYFIKSGGIPKYGLPLGGWPKYGIPGVPDIPEIPSGGATQPRRGRYEPKYYKDHELLEALEEFKRKKIIRDDQEFMELLTMILKSGIL